MKAFLIVKRFAIKNILYILCAIITALAVIYLENTIPHYKFECGLFLPSRLALNCLLPSPIKTLGTIIDLTATTSLFIYFIAAGIKVAQEMGTTAEPKIISQPILIYFSVLIFTIAQYLILGEFAVSCN